MQFVGWQEVGGGRKWVFRLVPIRYSWRGSLLQCVIICEITSVITAYTLLATLHVNIPSVEVHISNVHKREELRQSIRVT